MVATFAEPTRGDLGMRSGMGKGTIYREGRCEGVCVRAMCAKLILRCMCLLEGKGRDVFHACLALPGDK